MKNIMKLFLYTALPLALIALGSCSYPKNITFKADSQTGALSGL
ncbi:secreted protein, partial [human gut metagenome]